MLKTCHTLEGRVVDVVAGEEFPGRIIIEGERVVAVERCSTSNANVIVPGFIDAHVHVESSMLVPREFARLALPHGTVGTVSDPHEIANVLGADGVRFMIENARGVPFHFCFGAPSCVPATTFETAGATLEAPQVAELLALTEIGYLSEVMNYPGVLAGDPSLLSMIESARRLGKPVDGHAPGLRGADAARYAAYGITTDHECTSKEEALDKLRAGMSILIREGSGAKNFDALITLLATHPEQIMFCSDDMHPNDLARGHMNLIAKRAIARGIDRMKVWRALSLNPVRHYKLDVGLLQPGDLANAVVLSGDESLDVLATYVRGAVVADRGAARFEHQPSETPNKFARGPVAAGDFKVRATGTKIRVIVAHDGQLVTSDARVAATVREGEIVSDIERDCLKLVVVNRYCEAPAAVGFISGTGLLEGAFASTVAHDSHNIVAVGVDDEALARAINALVEVKGGIAVAADDGVQVLPLPVAGLMSPDDGYLVGARYEALDAKVKTLGTTLAAPFMTLSFMALLVIPALKLSDKGLFDGSTFTLTSVVEP